MADYDVAARRLTSPPATAYLTPYRPGVEMQNLGIYSRIAYGTLSIYNKTTGLLIKTFAVISPLIPPGEERVAESAIYWTPPEVGTYFAIATVTCVLDQVEPNNHLSPATFVVTAEPPPPPPEVPAHAAQHENNGTDELTLLGLPGLLADPQTPTLHSMAHEQGGQDVIGLDGLPGLLADAQTPTEHKSSHEYNGDDKISVAGLSGVLADGQTPTEHKTSHEYNGDDKISVAGLSGELADDQPPKGHGATKHDSTVEATANKGAASGYSPLDVNVRIPLQFAHHASRNFSYANDLPGTPTLVQEGTVKDLSIIHLGPIQEAERLIFKAIVNIACTEVGALGFVRLAIDAKSIDFPFSVPGALVSVSLPAAMNNSIIPGAMVTCTVSVGVLSGGPVTATHLWTEAITTLLQIPPSPP